MNPVCPHCSSSETTYKAKAGAWECLDCEERFSAPASAQEPFSARTRSLPARIGDRALQPKRIFFSYGHDANRELVDRFKEDLEKRGHEVWIDYKQIGAWDDWKGSITRGIHDAQMAMAFLSVHSTRDPGVCRNEVAMALHHFGTVYPILLEHVPLESIPATIAHLQWPDLSRWRDLKDQSPGEFERFYEEKLVEIIDRVEGEATRFASECEVLRRVLAPSNFDSKFIQHLDGFVGREWCFNEFETWLDEKPESRVFQVQAGPGFGKSALAVQIANRYRGAVVGTWFCDSQSNELSSPHRALRSIAFQLALRWDDYRARLLPHLGLFAGSEEEAIREAIEAIEKKNLKDLFETLLASPLAGLIWREHKLVILMDALDEANDPAGGHNELASLIGGEFLNLPKWITFVVTSRPDAQVAGHLQRFQPFEIASGDGRNGNDLRDYARQHLAAHPALAALAEPERVRLLDLLVQKSGGMILYLRMVTQGLNEGTLKAGQLERMEAGLPGLYGRYYQSFEQRFGARGYGSSVQGLVRILLAAPGPLPLPLAARILGLDKEGIRRQRDLLAGFLVESPAGITFFHKTLAEWLSDENAGPFFTDQRQGARALAKFLWNCLKMRKKNGHGLTEVLPWERQILDWLPSLLRSLSKETVGNALAALAGLARERLRYFQAEALYRRALAAREKTLGPEHPSTLRSVNNLGLILKHKGDYDAAEILLRRALEGQEKTHGSENPHTLTCISNLGNFLRDKGDYDAAEILCLRALEAREKILGPEHPNTLISVNSLGNLLADKGDYDGAEVLYRRALEGREKVLGREHPNTLTCVNDLGYLLRKKGDYDAAEVLLCRALEGCEKNHGPEHPHTLTCISNLGNLLRDKGDYDSAEILHHRALEGREKILGPEHPSTLRSVNNLGLTLKHKGDYDAAEILLRRALEAREKILGPEHPSTLSSLNNVGHILKHKGDYDAAEILLRRALEAREKILGPEHPNTLESVNYLAWLFAELKRLEEALQLLRKFAALSAAARSQLSYGLACYECLSGNTGEAKERIDEFLQKHPDWKDRALADDDLAGIRDWIAQL